MAASIRLRSDFDGDVLRRIARASKDGGQVRRLLALAAISDGGSGGEEARQARVVIPGVPHYGTRRARV